MTAETREQVKGNIHSLHLSKSTQLLHSWAWAAVPGGCVGIFLLILLACSVISAIPVA